MKPEFCAEIRRPLKNSSKLRFSSGYAIGTNLVLTCSHGLHHENVDESAEITITWRNAKGESLDPVNIKPEDICWENKDLDVALVRCPYMDEQLLPQQILSFSYPKAKKAWESGGYLARLEDVEGERKFMNPRGEIPKNFKKADNLELWCEMGHVENADLWAGFSGAPVFVDGKIIGVVKVSNNGTGGQNLTAVAIAALMDSKDDEGSITFSQAIGWQENDERKRRQKRQFERMCEVIRGQKEVLTVLTKEINTHLPEETSSCDNIQSVVNNFNLLDDDQAIECIENTFSLLCQEKKYTQAEAVGCFAEAWLLILFEYDSQLEDFRADLKSSTCAVIDSPTYLPVPTEMMMAEAEERPVQLKLVSNQLVSPLDLGSLAEVGLDENGAEAKRQIEELLSRRLLSAGDQIAFEASIDAVTYDIARRNDHAGALLGKEAGTSRKASVSRILKNIFRIKGRRFYYSFKADDDFNTKAIEQLNRAYPLLAFLISRSVDEELEEDRYSFLSHIIAVGKGVTISEELD